MCCLEMATFSLLLDVLMQPETRLTATTIGAIINPGNDALLLLLLPGTRVIYGSVVVVGCKVTEKCVRLVTTPLKIHIHSVFRKSAAYSFVTSVYRVRSGYQ